MSRRLSPLLSVLALALAALAFALTSPATADPRATFTCPDGYALVPSLVSPKQDRNNDGFVCQKSNGGSSGPDDTAHPAVIDDTIL
jgi:hypothetical protein